MSDANTTAIAALLRSHPEECTAVVAALSSYGGTNALVIADAMREDRTPLSVERIGDILDAMTSADVCLRGREGRRWIYAVEHKERRAIARIGAAAWLRERVGPPSSTNPLNLGAIRLCTLAAEGARIGAIYRAAFAIGGTFPRNAAEYRARLLEVERVSMGLPVAPLDVDAEVAAVWGAGAPAKGEQQ